VTTPLTYFALFHLEPDGGIMITGSHNPPEFNGLKLCQGKRSLHGKEIQEIRRIIEEGSFSSGFGFQESYDAITPYLRMVKEKIKLERKLKVAVDCGNGCGGIFAPQLIRDLGCEVIELYCDVDGTFPNHHPDPTVEKNMRELIDTVKREKADVGIAYDGDADRIGVVDDTGSILWGDQILLFFARDILSRNPGAKIIFDVKCSQNLPDDIKIHGGIPLINATGHSLIKQRMIDEKALLAGEMSAHIFIGEDYFGYDDAVFASCRLLQAVSRSKVPLSKMMADVPKTFTTPEIRVPCPDEDKFMVVKDVTDYFKEHYEVVDIDGARILFDKGWGLIRASNTQPVLVLRFEALDESSLEEYKSIVREKLNTYASVDVLGHF
jgi:phosphomannomutase/phosphoglucomutase